MDGSDDDCGSDTAVVFCQGHLCSHNVRYLAEEAIASGPAPECEEFNPWKILTSD